HPSLVHLKRERLALHWRKLNAPSLHICAKNHRRLFIAVSGKFERGNHRLVFQLLHHRCVGETGGISNGIRPLRMIEKEIRWMPSPFAKVLPATAKLIGAVGAKVE